MAEEEAIPAAARAGVSRGVYVGTVVLIAIIAFVAGLGLSGVIFPRPTTTVQPPLIVATNTPFPPFESGDGANVVGFDIDVIGEIIDTATGNAAEPASMNRPCSTWAPIKSTRSA